MIEYLKMIKSYGDHCMVKMLDGEKYTQKSYADYYRDIRTSAQKLENILGEVRDKHIGILGSNDYEYMVLMAAIMLSRAVMVPLNNRESSDNLIAAIKRSDLDLIIIWETDLQLFNEELVTVVYKKDFFDNYYVEKELTDFTDAEESRTASIIFTSGSTGLAKGVELSVGSFFGKLKNNMPKTYANISEAPLDSVAYINIPFYHIGGIMPWLNWTEYGCTIAISVDAKNLFYDLENNKIQFAAVTPVVLKLWCKCIKKRKLDRLGGVKYIYVGGATVNPELIGVFISEGITLIQLYGMTETGGDIAVNYDMVHHGDSVGKAADGVDILIIDGEICVKSNNNMKGYYNNPEETIKVKNDGIIYTGDLGYVDEERYVYITGRKKNLIILSGGENVSPEEIENELYKNMHISECKVYEQNDRIAAEIFAPSALEGEIKQYIDTINTNFPIYKRIYIVIFRETEFEKTAIGKIKR